jgi:glucan phosphorylase
LESSFDANPEFVPVSDDFDSYCKTQDLIDEAYKNQDKWVSKTIQSVARMGFFTSGTLDLSECNNLADHVPRPLHQ